jgi:Flp pilus assembly pilin Flp
LSRIAEEAEVRIAGSPWGLIFCPHVAALLQAAVAKLTDKEQHASCDIVATDQQKPGGVVLISLLILHVVAYFSGRWAVNLGRGVMRKLGKLLQSVVRDEMGQGLVEYSILIGVIAVAVVGMAVAVGGWSSAKWLGLCHSLSGAAPSGLTMTC